MGVRAFVSNWLHGGVTARTSALERKYIVLSNTLALLSLVLTLAHVPVFLWLWRADVMLPLLILGAGALGYVAVILLIRNGRSWEGRVLLHVVSPVLICSEAVLLGPAVGVHWYLFLVFIAGLFTFSARQNRTRYFLVIFAAVCFFAVETFQRFQPGLIAFSDFEAHVLAVAVRVGLILGTLSFLGYVAASYDSAEESLEHERQRSDHLLKNILPVPIAEALKENQGTIADAYHSTSVLFADIVGFTPLADRIDPHELVRRLNVLFSRFDDLVAEHGLEKIKTIGDAYMVAAGVPVETADHAARLTRLAWAMRAEVARNREFGTELELRIGIHSGPVVAGVIGRTRFLYDLWGDTVNTAARMESHGLPGEVQISRATRDLLGPEFVTDFRGLVDIKGKGPMEAYLVRDIQEAA